MIELRSHLPIEQQVRAIGATWLDWNLGADGIVVNQGFGAQVRDAMQSRVGFLAEQGLAERRGQHVVLAHNLLKTLRDRELATVGKTLQEQTGKNWRPLQDGQQASDVYRRSIQLASGRFATSMLNTLISEVVASKRRRDLPGAQHREAGVPRLCAVRRDGRGPRRFDVVNRPGFRGGQLV